MCASHFSSDFHRFGPLSFRFHLHICKLTELVKVISHKLFTPVPPDVLGVQFISDVRQSRHRIQRHACGSLVGQYFPQDLFYRAFVCFFSLIMIVLFRHFIFFFNLYEVTALL